MWMSAPLAPSQNAHQRLCARGHARRSCQHSRRVGVRVGPLGPLDSMGPCGPTGPLSPLWPLRPLAPVLPSAHWWLGTGAYVGLLGRMWSIKLIGPVGPTGPIGSNAPNAPNAPNGPNGPNGPKGPKRAQESPQWLRMYKVFV